MLHHSNSFTSAATVQCCMQHSASGLMSPQPYDCAMRSANVPTSPCPKRDFQFRVIQVRQGPKWFIWPSLNQSQRKEKSANQKKPNNKTSGGKDNNNNEEKFAAEKQQKDNKNGDNKKGLHINLDSGYATGGCCSDPETTGQTEKILSPISPLVLFPFYSTVPDQIAPDSSRLPFEERSGMAKVTATNQPTNNPFPLSEPTTCRLPADIMKSLAAKQQQPQVAQQLSGAQQSVMDQCGRLKSTRVGSPPQPIVAQMSPLVHNNVTMSQFVGQQPYQNPTADECYYESQLKYQERFQELAARLELIQSTVSVTTPTIVENYADVRRLSNQEFAKISNASIKSDNTSASFSLPSSPSQHSAHSSACLNVDEADDEGANGAFEILAVSKKDNTEEETNEDEDEIEFEMDDEADVRFADSGYSFSTRAAETRNSSRSDSVVEYYSNNGCYTCITGACVIGGVEKFKAAAAADEDASKRYSLVINDYNNNNATTTQQQKNNNESINNNNNNNGNNRNNEDYICENCKHEQAYDTNVS